MLKFGVHPLIWTSAWTYDTVSFAERARDLGFGALDVPLRRADQRTVRETGARLKNLNMSAVGVLALGREHDITSDEDTTRQLGIEHLKKAVVSTQGVGATVLGGVIYAPIGKLVGRGPNEAETARSVEALKEVARFAQDYGVKLALEPVNRYETYMLNTVQDALKMVDLIGEPNIGVLLDTYHMNIEEKDLYQPIVAAGDRLFHMHCCENDRGIPGTGLVRWDDVFLALRDIKYQGVLSIESFVTNIPEIAAATCIWRTLAPDGDALAREGLAFLKGMAEKHGVV